MKSYEDISKDLQTILDEQKLTGDAAELCKKIAAYVYLHSQIDVVNALRESSLSTATLMNSKIALCMDNMYSVYRGLNPTLKLNIIFEAAFGKDKFDLVYTSNTFRLYAKEAISFQPTLDNTLNQKEPVQLELIISKGDKLTFSFDNEELRNRTNFPYYVDFLLPTKILASNLSESVFIYREVNGRKEEVKWTRVFTEHASSKKEENILYLLTIPDYGIRVFKKGYFNNDDLQSLKIEVLPYTTIEDINTYDLKKVQLLEGRLKSPKGKLLSELEDKNIQTELEQVINVSDEGEVILSGIDKDFYQMIVSPEISRNTVESLSYQANFSGRSSDTMISNNDILFLFSETFIGRLLSCNFQISTEGDSLQIFYVPNPIATPITDKEKEDFLARYDRYSLANNVNSILEGNKVSLAVVIRFVSEGIYNIAAEITNLCNEYNNKLGATLNKKELEGRINKLTGVSYVKSLEIIGMEEDVLTLEVDQYFELLPELTPEV